MAIFWRLLSRILFLAVLTPWLLSCGGEESLNDDVEFEITPDNPIASPADTSYVGRDGSIVTITGPWYLMVVNVVNNNSQYTLVVDSVTLESEVSNGNSILSSEYTISYEDTGCDPILHARVRYATIPPGGSFIGDGDCDGTSAGVGDTELWYIGSLPEGSSLNYKVEATLYGTFRDLTDAANPIRGRVEKKFYFSTQ
jgi:hypothetical protein